MTQPIHTAKQRKRTMTKQLRKIKRHAKSALEQAWASRFLGMTTK